MGGWGKGVTWGNLNEGSRGGGRLVSERRGYWPEVEEIRVISGWVRRWCWVDRAGIGQISRGGIGSTFEIC